MNFETADFDHFSFDLWLTLIKSNPEYKPARDRLFRSFFSIEEPLENVSAAIRHYDITCNKISESTGRHIRYDEIYLLVLSALGKDLNDFSTHKIGEFYQETAMLFEKYRPILLDENIRDLFDKITKEGKTISIMSNTAFIEGNLLRKVLGSYGLSDFISFQLYSDETGWSKPNPELFSLMKQNVAHIYNKTGVKILHIGDNEKADFQGAVNAGINAYLFSPK